MIACFCFIAGCSPATERLTVLPGTWAFPRSATWQAPAETLHTITDTALVGLDVVYDVEALVQKPERVSGPMPVYPGSALHQGIQGTVWLRCIIDTMGQVDPQSVTVVDSADVDLAASAVTVVVNSRFKPGMVRGRPVRALVKIPVTYGIRHGNVVP
jgi:TonB family protein